MTGCMAASWTAAIRGGETVMISAAGDEAGCSWTSSDGELQNGKLDGIEPRQRYGEDPSSRRRDVAGCSPQGTIISFMATTRCRRCAKLFRACVLKENMQRTRIT